MDLISNELGAVIGFVDYRVGFTYKITFKRLIASAISILLLIAGIIVLSQTIDYSVYL